MKKCPTCKGTGAAANAEDIDDIDVVGEYAFIATDCGDCDGLGVLDVRESEG